MSKFSYLLLIAALLVLIVPFNCQKSNVQTFEEDDEFDRLVVNTISPEPWFIHFHAECGSICDNYIHLFDSVARKVKGVKFGRIDKENE